MTPHPLAWRRRKGAARTGNLVFDPSNPSYMYTVFAYENIEDGPNRTHSSTTSVSPSPLTEE